ncbi:MAG TPA: glycosyltransferase [Anaerolineales bacterium]|nr:glycosyltransferase [Anaerolineales bacterium]
MANILVSVVIPCYNQGHFALRAIQSVLDQGLDECEIILIDDGSQDDTGELLGSITDSRLRYHYQPNQGLAAARNKGLHLAKGEFIVFLDADDELAPSFFAKTLPVLRSNSEWAGVYTLSVYIDPDEKILPGPVVGRIVPPDQLYSELLQGGFLPIMAAVVKRKAVLSIRGFESSLSGTADWDYWLRLAKENLLVGIPEPLAYYRVYPGSMSTNAELMNRDRLQVLKKHFGTPDDHPSSWSDQKRVAYAMGYRANALALMEQGNFFQAYSWVRKALLIKPEIFTRLDTYYELACCRQSKGQRGRAELLDFAQSELDVLGVLEVIERSDAGENFKRQAASRAYQALGSLADVSGEWALARKYFSRSVFFMPTIILEPGFLRRYFKLFLGKRVVERLRKGILSG